MPRLRLKWTLALLLAGAPAALGKERPDVGAGLAWLAARQGADGSWGQKDKLALTGMSGLALLASGSTPTRGPYARHITRALQFVMSTQQDGRAFRHESSGYSAIHNHGYALLFVTQAYGEGGPLDDAMRRAIEGGLQAAVQSQRTNGGFSYYLYDVQDPRWKDMWRVDEASTTVALIQAMRGARNAGFTVERDALNRAARYIADSQHAETGGFVYSIGGGVRVSFIEGSNRPTFAITAAATAVLHALGTYEGPVVERGIAYMEAFIPPSRKKVPFFYYAHYYAAQVMHLVGGPRGERWMEAIRKELAERQRPDGRWPADPEDSLAQGDSELLNTAWALQVCLIERAMLPIHER
ncbi:MAG: hypothetical protein KF878_15730 [Planctomycetes bacterium]|nr:hypothetical protein [Planctomycetota bacterium]